MSDMTLYVLGSGGVGKSALTLRLVNDHFVEDYDPTIEDSYRKPIVVDDVRVLLTIVDTAGQEEYATMRDHALRSGDAYLLVYAIDDRNSFDEAKHLYQDLLLARDGCTSTPPVVLAGNKVDLAVDRKVTFVEARESAKHIFKCPFLETSAKDGTNAHAAFFEVVREVWRHRRDKTIRAFAAASKKKKKGSCTLV